jgi:PAS domain S-box-containing protein
LSAKPFLDWIHPEDRRVALDETRRLHLDGDAVSFDARVASRESRYRRFSWNAFAFRDRQIFYAIGQETPEPEAGSPPGGLRVRLPSSPDGILFVTGESRVAVIAADTPAVRRVLDSGSGRGVEILLPRSERAGPLEVALGPPGPGERSPDVEYPWASVPATAEDAILVRSPEDLVTAWNPAAERLYGYAAKDIVGHSVSLLVPPECAGEDRRLRGRILGGERTPAFETERLRQDGHRLEVQISVAPLLDGVGAVTGFAEMTRDVSERKREERRLVRKADELARSNAELQEYGAILAHDLQEPLAALVSYLGDLRSRFTGQPDDEVGALAVFALDAAEWMRRLTRDLLELARLAIPDQGLGPVEVENLLDEVLNNLRPQIQKAGARVLRGILPPVRAHRTQLGQVFQNLISNAIRYRSAAPAQVRVEAEERPGEVLFRISDNGVGIAPDRLRQIFRPMLRRHEEELQPGLGMGLPIASKIVERHGGRMWAESTPNQGSTFFFTLPTREERG